MRSSILLRHMYVGIAQQKKTSGYASTLDREKALRGVRKQDAHPECRRAGSTYGRRAPVSRTPPHSSH